jgi:hypothetical protein
LGLKTIHFQSSEQLRNDLVKLKLLWRHCEQREAI